jgi:hypothetical protein
MIQHIILDPLSFSRPSRRTEGAGYHHPISDLLSVPMRPIIDLPDGLCEIPML